MSGFLGGGGTAAAIANQFLSQTYERGGFGANGDGTNIPANASPNTKGTYTQLLFGGAAGVTQNALAGFYLYVGYGVASTARVIFDISFDGGTTTHVPNYYIEPSNPSEYQIVFIPMAVPAGADIRVRCQSSSASQSIYAGIVGIIRTSSHPAMFTVCESLTLDETARALTRASGGSGSTGDFVLQGSGSTTFHTLVASLAQNYKAFNFSGGSNGTTPAATNRALIRIAKGAAASEVEIGVYPTLISASSVPFAARPQGYIEVSVPAGDRLSFQPLVATPGTDAIRMAVHGFR